MINKENNFPIKYAVMPLYKQDGWDAFGYSTYDLAYYLPMPCYLIKESKVYQADGSDKMEYEVVFFTEKDEYHFLKNDQQIPEFNFNSQCTNSTIVKSIYEDYESAKAAVKLEHLNEDYIIHGALLLHGEEFLKKTKENEEELKSRYEFIEKEILPKQKSKQKVLK